MNALVIPDGQRYTCLGCGACCRNWALAVSPDVADSLQQQPWAQRYPDLAGRELFVTAGNQLRFAQNPDGSCVFLDAQQRCRIHADLGFAAKSLVCKLFPLSFVRTPRETVLYLSFACPAIARSQGELLAGQRAELEILAAQAQQFSVTFKDVVALAPGVSVAWDDYAEVAEKLRGLFSRADASLRDRLVAGGLLVDAAVAAAAAGTLSAFLRDTAPDSFLAPARALLPEGKRQQNLMLAAFIGPVESLRRDVLASIGGSLQMVMQRGKLALKKSLRQTVDLRALAAVDAPLFMQPHEPLERFVQHARQRHAFIFPLPLRDGYRVFLLALGLARWYARASAALAGRTAVNDDDIVAGIMLAERHYLSHSTFFAALTQQSLTASFLRRMFDAPRYSATIFAE